MKQILYLLPVLLLLSAGCKNNDTPNTHIALSVFSAFNKHDWNAMARCYEENAAFLDPSLGTTYVTMSHADINEKYTTLQKLSPDIHDEVKEMYADKDKVIVEFISTGTINGKKWQLPICSIFTIRNGKIIKDATYYDQ